MGNDNKDKPIEIQIKNRDTIIIRTSILGIVANVFLAGFKALVGGLSGSIAIVLDAVNNLSDALSSVITIIGTKLANRLPDKKHPLGHGRTEYLSAMIVAAIVLYAGGTSILESIKKIITPQQADYSAVTLIIISVAIVVKIILGRFVKKRGEKVNSGALIASGADATFDAILSASVLASAIIYITTGISLEAWVGVIISVVIIKSGIEMMIETLDDIIGHRPDAELTKRIKKLLCEEPQVRGAYDLIISDYGPGKLYATVHLELPDVMSVEEVDILTRKLQTKIYKESGIVLIGVGVYSYNTKNPVAGKMRDDISKLVRKYDWLIQIHGFFVDEEAKTIRFDAVLGFDISSKEAIKIITDEVNAMYPDYKAIVVPDVDVSD